MNLNRRHFMQLLALGGANLGLINSSVQAKAESDLEIVSLAIVAEQLAVEAYTKAVASKQFTGILGLYFRTALRQESDHLKALTKVAKSLGGTITDTNFVFEPGVFESPIEMLRLMNALEDAFVGAYLGALPLIKDKKILSAAGAILGVEAGHRVILREARLNFRDPAITGARVPNDRTYESALTPTEAAAALKPFRR
jgi:Ferritin-like domain